MSPAAADLRQAVTDWHSTEDDPPGAATALLRAAAAALARGDTSDVPPALWHAYLDATACPAFLLALQTREARERWVETTFRAIRASNYSLRTMLAQRALSHPDRLLFIDAREVDAPSWSFAEVERYTRAVAGVITDVAPEPRVAILCENSIDSACADLACLAYGVPVSPLNVHLDDDTLAWIIERLDVNVVVTDTDERHARIHAAAGRSGRRLRVLRAGGRAPAVIDVDGSEGVSLRHACARIDLGDADRRLAARPVDLMRSATVMFTSGSTGRAKGVVFSEYMLLAKRFARAAALPAVGDSEVMLCYLPLFHTFGRFLELLGMLYWRGTYVFAGNPSAEALIAELPRVRPTGLIGVPVRWQQIRERSLEAQSAAGSGDGVRQVLGDRLRWGLSAAGHLDPQVFRFFHRHGVDLCSGFGMTEATGGITMTPPAAYEDGTVGIPLPGIRARLTEAGELQIAGPYVASYLDEAGAPGHVARPDDATERWLATGDLFQRRANGYLAIVDRLKDIYKNTRGQTVAPQRVERRFTDVPGVRRAFLAGDHRDHNVLLVVPDRDDPLLARRTEEQVHEYIAKIVAAANAGLAPYERVVSFALLDRDFDPERGELTPKGSFRRSVIAENFAPVIERLYQSNHVDVAVGELRVRIPRWLFRDVGVLEEDIVGRRGILFERRSGRTLRVRRGRTGAVRIGDLEYGLDGDLVDLGAFARQPRLWLANPALVAFAPCRAGWDVPLGNVSEQVRLPRRRLTGGRRVATETQVAKPNVEPRLQEIHALCSAALHDDTGAALVAIDRLAAVLAHADARTGSAVRRRLEALAFHADEPVRARAYHTLLLDVPVIDYDTVFPAFLESGRTFLTSESIASIASARHGERRLQALRQRLYSYRTRLAWPGTPARRRQLRRVFRLLADFARRDPDHFHAVHAELASWALFDPDPPLARAALRSHDELTAWLEQRLRGGTTAVTPAEGRVVFDFGTAPAQRQALERILFDPTFLRHSVMHAFNDDGFSWDRVGAGGVWVSPLPAQHELQLQRVAINLVDGRHFDLLLATGRLLRSRGVRDTILWLTALSSHAFGAPALPRFGAWRPDLGAVTIAYLSELSAWDRIREASSRFDARDRVAFGGELHRLYVRAIAAFFRAWQQAGRRIIPGSITPANVVLPDADFQERTSILSLAGWRSCDDALGLVRPLLRNFFRMAEAHYPALRGSLQPVWLFEACTEALGVEESRAVLDAVDADLAAAPETADVRVLLTAVREHRRALEQHDYVPLPVACAIDRHSVWERANPAASAQAREESVVQMLRLYRMERFPDAFRYHLYRHTYFARAAPAVAQALERLVRRGLEQGRTFAGQLEELSRVQSLLDDAHDRAVFSRMVFPHAHIGQTLEVRAVGEPDDQRLVVRSEVRDQAGCVYAVREPVSAAEVGQLYRLVMDAGYRMRIQEQDRHLVLTDGEDRVVGGLAYRWEDGGAVAVEAIAIGGSLVNRGLGGALLEDFCVRMAAQGARLARTNFFLGGFFTKHGFHVDERWGGVVRILVNGP